MFNERFIGTLSVYHTDAAFYRDDHRRLLDRVSEQAAAVINNSMLFEQTQEDSLTDPLTGLPNTRFLFMHLTRELARAERLKAEVSLMVMDLDNFKEINDNHGHHVGDRALCEVARVLRAAIRPYDICVRYAGDEFIVVLSGCGADEAEHKRQELQKGIDDVYFEARPGKRLQLGISIGAAVFPQDGESYEALLATADSRMYQDKSGRKRRTGRDGPPTDQHARRQHGLSRADRPRHPARGRGDSVAAQLALCSRLPTSRATRHDAGIAARRGSTRARLVSSSSDRVDAIGFAVRRGAIDATTPSRHVAGHSSRRRGPHGRGRAARLSRDPRSDARSGTAAQPAILGVARQRERQRELAASS